MKVLWKRAKARVTNSCNRTKTQGVTDFAALETAQGNTGCRGIEQLPRKSSQRTFTMSMDGTVGRRQTAHMSLTRSARFSCGDCRRESECWEDGAPEAADSSAIEEGAQGEGESCTCFCSSLGKGLGRNT